jgi:hypothetical protein
MVLVGGSFKHHLNFYQTSKLLSVPHYRNELRNATVAVLSYKLDLLFASNGLALLTYQYSLTHIEQLQSVYGRLDNAPHFIDEGGEKKKKVPIYPYFDWTFLAID